MYNLPSYTEVFNGKNANTSYRMMEYRTKGDNCFIIKYFIEVYDNEHKDLIDCIPWEFIGDVNSICESAYFDII